MTRPTTDAKKTGASVVGVGIAACAACCAVPALGLLTALLAGASVAALAAGGILLAAIVAGLGAAFIAWRRRRATQVSCSPAAESEPVSITVRSGR